MSNNKSVNFARQQFCNISQRKWTACSHSCRTSLQNCVLYWMYIFSATFTRFSLR